MMKPLPLSNTLHYRTTKSVSPEDLYADRDPEALGEHFMRHLDRMTVEGLHSKSDIACELAHRDTEIAALQVEVARLTSCLERANSQTEEFERKWYLSCDEVEALRAEREPTPSVEAAHEMGATGAPATEPERLLFEAWMRGHCWALSATWRGTQYKSDCEEGGNLDPRAMQTRRLWAAWRDRAALSIPPCPVDFHTESATDENSASTR